MVDVILVLVGLDGLVLRLVCMGIGGMVVGFIGLVGLLFGLLLDVLFVLCGGFGVRLGFSVCDRKCC